MKYTSIIFLSRIEALKLTPSADTVMISLILPETPVSFKPGYHAVLQLTLHDIAEERVRIALGSIPDEAEMPLLHEYKGEQYIWPDMHHARAIVAFLAEHEGCNLRIVVHCAQGKSRSSAVAKFASEKYNISILNADLAYSEMVAMADTSRANPRLLRLLDKANAKEFL
jgi:predicted protein tyrosine phosphatase